MQAVMIEPFKNHARVVNSRKDEDSLEFTQRLVEGYIECPHVDIGLPPGYCAVVNEEGTIFHMPVNISPTPVSKGDGCVFCTEPLLRGNIVVIGINERGEFVSVKSEDVDTIKKALEERKFPTYLLYRR